MCTLSSSCEASQVDLGRSNSIRSQPQPVISNLSTLDVALTCSLLSSLATVSQVLRFLLRVWDGLWALRET